MIPINISKRNIGVNFSSEGEAEINLWAPHAKKLNLELTNGGNISLKKAEYGYWQANTNELKAGDCYKIQINEKQSWPEPSSLFQAEGVHNASQCIDLNVIKKIHCQSWQGIDYKDLIIYELHIGCFTKEGTFKAAEKKLSHLKELGVNALKIMPINAFPGKRNWGYDGVYPFAVQESYGTPKEFAHLVKSCHEHGLAVILDVIYNHLGPEGNYVSFFGPLFTGKYSTPWGKAINFDDNWSDGVRQFFIENALMWLRDFHVDGLRLDAVHAIKDSGPSHFLQDLSLYVSQLNTQNNGKHFLIGECDLNDVRYISPRKTGGYGLDGQWCDEWHHALHALLTKEKQGYYEDFGNIEQLAKSFENAYVYTGEFSLHRKRFFGTSTEKFTRDKFIIFTQNHDQVGNRMKGERLSELCCFESRKLAAAAMILSPFTPMLFMGEEYDEKAPFLYFIDHGDPHLLEMVKKGRKKEFRAFMKNAEPDDPGAESTFLKSKLRWTFQDQKEQKQMLSFYKKLIALRKKYHALQTHEPQNMQTVLLKDQKIITLKRFDENDTFNVVLNFSDSDQKMIHKDMDLKNPEIILSSAHEKWGGSLPDHTTFINHSSLFIPSKSVILIKTT